MTEATVVQEPPAALLAAVESELKARRAVPGATYRLQFHNGFGFAQATAIVGYLRDLGVTHVYASPLLQALPNSTHGYDVCDYVRFDESLGGDAGFSQFSQALEEAKLGLILDIVPNHMSTDTSNAWWRDVLENGPNSPYAQYFDIDWAPVKVELENKVLLPLLGQQYGVVLESGEFHIEHAEGEFWLRYFDHRLPLGPKTTLPLLTRGLDALTTSLGETSEQLIELKSILTALEHLPPQTATSPEAVVERHREKEVIKRRLRELEVVSPEIRDFVQANVAYYNGNSNEPDPYGLLDGILQEQPYRLCHWRAASDEINYRRFFDINQLTAVCMENPEVYRASHELVMRELGTGRVEGLRIDHVDGLFAPETYLWRLQWSYLAELLARAWKAAPDRATEPAGNGAPGDSWAALGPVALVELCGKLGLKAPGPADLLAVFGGAAAKGAPSAPVVEEPPTTTVREYPLFVEVEKILGAREPLPPSWPIAGTTGYDFVHDCNGVFLDPAGWDATQVFYRKLTGDARSFNQVVREAKLLILRAAMASELQMLAHRLNQISERHRRTRDFTLNMLRFALREILIHFPVYRVYPGSQGIPERERAFVQSAVAAAKRQNPATDAAIFDFIRDVLLLEGFSQLTETERHERELFVGRFQQVTSPVMAKGVEDTSFYVYVPLVSVNEVGNDPREAAVSPANFHHANANRQATFPRAMLASTTHDSKRTEDLRARLHVLSEIPLLWRKRVQRWYRMNRRKRATIDGQPAPSATDEYLFYQSLVGIWPLARPGPAELKRLTERLQEYMAKATHEAKQHTSWVNPDERYDRAVQEFVSGVLDPAGRNPFLDNVQAFHDQLAPWGLYSALAQLVLKATSPGFPDFYQGQELWDFSLVDPDNRRPVDFSRGAQLLAELQKSCADAEGRAKTARQLADNPLDDRLKLLVTWKLLELRRTNRRLFDEGEYVPLEVQGPGSDHVVALARPLSSADAGTSAVLVVVPRLLLKFALSQQVDPTTNPQQPWTEEFWQGTTVDCTALAGLEGTNIFTGATETLSDTLPVGAAFHQFPVGVWICRS